VTDAIEIRGLRVLGSHGALPGEQDRAQPFEIDLDVEVDAARAARTDERADAVDYGRLVAAAAGVVRGESRRLLETLAEAIAGALLEVPGVLGATVTVRKLRPPVPEQLVSAGVRVSRRRAPG
jgi:dihydroneopterin aldolase